MPAVGERLVKRFIAQTVFLLLIAAPGAADAGTTMRTAGKAFAPPAFASFCVREPRLCNNGGGKKTVVLAPEKISELKQINSSVNASIRERSDRANVGKEDDWRVPTAYGDCEDFAILKKRELLKRGWPASALLLTVARYRGEGHTVLARSARAKVTSCSTTGPTRSEIGRAPLIITSPGSPSRTVSAGN